MRTAFTSLASAVGALAFASVPAGAQVDAVAPCAAPAGALSDPIGVPVVIIARLHADAIVFDADPDVRITVNGCAPGPDQLVTTSNLPDPIVPGVRYTDVEVTAEYRGVLTLECASQEAVARLCEELRGRN